MTSDFKTKNSSGSKAGIKPGQLFVGNGNQSSRISKGGIKECPTDYRIVF